ncbi:hypothetical protein MED92_13658 [Neptuniibacter caesariensis]|uniref:Cryptochrome/photolyase family protein n=1 Tax=Neptuniibacter caesariensis TaxID=207954 RepID=A0A7U8C603_NEPCE|nr:hypothetical protein MED92_13658 [Neptuniibacter caesariensis]
MGNTVRNLCLILGDQLNHDSLIWEDFDPALDEVLMIETVDESNQPPSNKQRTVLFISAMRHFSQELREKGFKVNYFTLRDRINSLNEGIDCVLATKTVSQIKMVLPGEKRVLDTLSLQIKGRQLSLQVLPDNHFMTEPGEFQHWLKDKKQPRMEYWYRYLRKKHNILINDFGKPEGEKWNFDASNRRPFGKKGPPTPGNHPDITPDNMTLEVIDEINTLIPDLPGSLNSFEWPVCRKQALSLLDSFISDRLPLFGDFQDAMWQQEPFLNHSWLSSSLNLKLLHPWEVIEAAIQAYKNGNAPLNAVEGFIRQILGWREYVRGLYWTYSQKWEQMNALEHHRDLPAFYWNGDTKMNCLRESISQVLEKGYGHHIQRLMVTGLFALLYGADPQQVHRWYLGMYVDAVAWVEVPNTLGMSQFADNGILASKPYIASGNYINRMSNYCEHCPYSPKVAHGENACPFTTLYWAFVADKQDILEGHPRLSMQVKHWYNKPEKERNEILKNREHLISTLSI